jgi:tricarballylate dehydrogenase
LLVDQSGAIEGILIATPAGRQKIMTKAMILACGGFEANPEMRARYLGQNWDLVKVRGTRYNTGDGIAMARTLGADVAGEWNGMHIEPVDPRSKSSAPVVLLYPYGIVVDRSGRRFFDEGGGLVHETWEWLSRHIHFALEGRVAYAILDSRVLAIADWQRATRSEVPPFQSESLAGLAKLIGANADNLAATVAGYNAACTGDPARFDATCCDGLAAAGMLDPPKSSWARAISEPPFLAWPLIGAIAYTFGGLATDDRARVLRNGVPIPGLYAAGEITGHFYATAPNAVSVLRAFVFGRIAGREAVASALPGPA